MNNNSILSISAQDMQSAVILAVDDNLASLELLQQILSPYHRVFTANSGEDAIAFCSQTPPDMVILELHMPGLDGLLTYKLLKSIPNMESCPIVFSSAVQNTEREIECWDAGGVDFINKPFSSETLVKRISSHIKVKLQNDLRDNMVFVDIQTGLYNRRFFNDFYERQVSLAIRNNDPLSILMFELQNPALFSEDTPHEISQSDMKTIALIISNCLSRPTDTIMRYSESQFAVLLPDTYIFGAKHIAQKVLNEVDILKESVDSFANPNIHVTGGIASLEALQRNSNLIEQAQINLMQNKQSGKSMVA